jgi:palmitoyltransferase
MSVFGLAMVAWFFFRCVGQNFQSCDAIMPGPLAFILTLFGVFEGFLFSLFTCIMFCTQVHAICTDETVSTCTAVDQEGFIVSVIMTQK